MLQSFFNGLSGLLSFSRGLQSVSDNVANMNTPGFRGRDTFFQSVGSGLGATVESGTARTVAGQLQQTGSDTDLAIVGEGFFVLRDDQGQLHYTRAGEFQFDENRILVDKNNKYQVMALNSFGQLANIDISTIVTKPPEATTTVNMSGILSSAQSPKAINNVVVYDRLGGTHKLTVTLTDVSTTTPNTWNVSITDQAGLVLSAVGSHITFDPSNKPLPPDNQVVASFQVGGVAQNVNFDFGSSSSPHATQWQAAAPVNPSDQIAADVVNGHATVGVTSTTFDEKGVLTLNYSNGDKDINARIALASFSDESSLLAESGSLYQPNQEGQAKYGYATDEEYGKIQSKSRELSNVDLTQEFADMLIIQRGYQASSRVMTVSNDMVEQLYRGNGG